MKNSFFGDEKVDVISYVSTIANMEGGHLVIGVKDKTLEIVWNGYFKAYIQWTACQYAVGYFQTYRTIHLSVVRRAVHRIIRYG